MTTSGLTVLDDEGRVTELSRMLAGLEDSDTALRPRPRSCSRRPAPQAGAPTR